MLIALFTRTAAMHRMMVVAMVTMLDGGAPPTPPVRTVAHVDLDRYLGDWFEVARFPNRFQRTCAGDVRAAYARRTDGRIDVVNRCRTSSGATIEARGVARVVDARTSARLKVRFAPSFLSFLPLVWGDYWIIGLADDYSWAVVGSPDREYLWILSRSRAMPADLFASARSVASANGFDVSRLVATAHTGGSPVDTETTRGR